MKSVSLAAPRTFTAHLEKEGTCVDADCSFEYIYEMT